MDNTVAFFKVGSIVFSLCSHKELSSDVGSELATKPYLGFTLAQNFPSEQAVDELFASLRTSGVTIIKEPIRPSWGGYFADPEGHLWEVAYNPPFRYDNNGLLVLP